jgi:hypothetical protein
MLPDTGKKKKKQRNAEYAKHINDPVLSSLKMEGIGLLFFNVAALYVHVVQMGFEVIVQSENPCYFPCV